MRSWTLLWSATVVWLGIGSLTAADRTKDGTIRTISQGQRVDVKRHLEDGKFTIVEFFHDDWTPDGLELSAKIEAQVRARDDMVLRRIKIPSWGSPVARQYGITHLPHYRFWDPDGKLVKQYSPEDADRAPASNDPGSAPSRNRGPSARLSAPKILTISTGQEVAIQQNLVPGHHTLIEFYADW